MRVFHWSLVLCVCIAWLGPHDDNTLHTTVGYLAGGLVVARLFWGAIGSRYARFAQFIYVPAVVYEYLKDIVSHREARYIGHNPAGGAMIMALILSVLVVATSGWMLTTDAFWGVLWMQRLHGFVARCILFLLVFHIGGVVLASLHHKENLVRSMLNGKKRPPTLGDVD